MVATAAQQCAYTECSTTAYFKNDLEGKVYALHILPLQKGICLSISPVRDPALFKSMEGEGGVGNWGRTWDGALTCHI